MSGRPAGGRGTGGRKVTEMARTARTFRRGWGGVAGMALACALVVAGALVPLQDDASSEGTARPNPATGGSYASAQDAAQSCDQPVYSLDPAGGSIDGAAVQRIKEYGKLRVGVDQNSYLWGFRDPATNKFAGFDIDLVRAIAKDILGDENAVQFLTVPTADRIVDIQKRYVDMVVRTMTVNSCRAKQVAFSAPYFTAGQQVLTADPSITGYDGSLKGKRLCFADGSTAEDVVNGKIDTIPPTPKGTERAYGARVLEPAKNQLDCLVLVQLHLADAVLTDNALGAGQAAQDPTVHLVGHPVTVEPYGVAMSLKDADLVRRVNKVLAGYGADGRWAASYKHWLADDLPGMTQPKPQYR